MRIFVTQETKCNNWENTKENKRITLRNSNTKIAFQRFMAKHGQPKGVFIRVLKGRGRFSDNYD